MKRIHNKDQVSSVWNITQTPETQFALECNSYDEIPISHDSVSHRTISHSSFVRLFFSPAISLFIFTECVHLSLSPPSPLSVCGTIRFSVKPWPLALPLKSCCFYKLWMCERPLPCILHPFSLSLWLFANCDTQVNVTNPCNYLQCIQPQGWIHRRFSRIHRLNANTNIHKPISIEPKYRGRMREQVNRNGEREREKERKMCARQ